MGISRFLNRHNGHTFFHLSLLPANRPEIAGLQLVFASIYYSLVHCTYKFSVCHCQAFFKKILIGVPSTCRESAIAPYGVVVSILETTTLEEHRKVYRQIQDRTFLHHIRAIEHPGKDADVIG